MIRTTQAGVDLYHSYMDGADAYIEQLDRLKRWHGMVLVLEKVNQREQVAAKCRTIRNLIDLDALLCIAVTDLGLIVKELFVSGVMLQKTFYVRQAYLVVHETFYNLNSSPDKRRVLKELVTDAADPDLTAQFENSTRLLKEFNRDFGVTTKIADIRHTVGGHIHTDFGKWHDTVSLLDAEETGRMLIEFLKVVAPLQLLSRKLLELEIGRLEELNKQESTDFEQKLAKLEAVLATLNDKITDRDKHFDINLLRNSFL